MSKIETQPILGILNRLNAVSDVVFEWVWSQIEGEIAPRRRSTYRAILVGAWQAKTYADIASEMQYSEVYLRQDLAPQVWKLLSARFDSPLSKKTFKAALSDCYEARCGENPEHSAAVVDRANQGIVESSGELQLPPFGDVGCIACDQRFFDRTEVLDKILVSLGNHWNVSLIGERQVGKSSLLAKVLRQAPAYLNWDADRFIYLDMELIHSEETFFQRLCKGLKIDYCRGYDLLEATEGRQYVVCIDEIEKLRNPEKFSGDERDELRGLADGAHRPFTLITASRTPLDQLFPDDDYGTSPFFNIFREVQLVAFSPGVAMQFLQHRLVGAPVQFSDVQMQGLVQASSGHPAMLQQLAQALYAELL